MAEPKLYPSEQAFERTGRDRPYVCMAPSSVWFTKQWPKEQWIQLIAQMPENLDILLIGAPGDMSLCEEIKEASKSERVMNMAGKYNLLESAALISKAEMSYVNDSAPMHLASAMNAPVSAIYCSTVPSFGFGPRSKRAYVFQTEENLPCRPCGLHGKKECPLGHFKCSQISPELIAKESLAHYFI
jgi:heptosyltransferase-2